MRVTRLLFSVVVLLATLFAVRCAEDRYSATVKRSIAAWNAKEAVWDRLYKIWEAKDATLSVELGARRVARIARREARNEYRQALRSHRRAVREHNAAVAQAAQVRRQLRGYAKARDGYAAKHQNLTVTSPTVPEMRVAVKEARAAKDVARNELAKAREAYSQGRRDYRKKCNRQGAPRFSELTAEADAATGAARTRALMTLLAVRSTRRKAETTTASQVLLQLDEPNQATLNTEAAAAPAGGPTPAQIAAQREYEVNCGEVPVTALKQLGTAALAARSAYKEATDTFKSRMRAKRTKQALLAHYERRRLKYASLYVGLKSKHSGDPEQSRERVALRARHAALRARRHAYTVLAQRTAALKEATARWWAAHEAEVAARADRDKARAAADVAKAFMEKLMAEFEKAERFNADDPATSAEGSATEEAFEPMEGTSLYDVATSSWEHIFGINNDEGKRQLVSWDVSVNKWTSVPGAGAGSLHIAASCDGVLWRLDNTGAVLRHAGKGSWEKAGAEPRAGSPPTPAFKSFAVDPSGAAWGVSTAGKLYRLREGAFVEAPAATTPAALTTIAVGCNGDVWAINDKGGLFHLEDPGASFWKLKGEKVAAVTVGEVTYAVGTTGRLYEYRPAGEAEESKVTHWFRWTKVTDALRAAAAEDGTLVVTTSSGSVLKHELSKHQNPEAKAQADFNAGGVWEVLPGSERVAHLVLGPNKLMWATTYMPYLLLKRGEGVEGDAFMPVADANLQAVSQGCDRSMWGINSIGEAVRWSRKRSTFEPRGATAEERKRKIAGIAVCDRKDVWAIDAESKRLLHWWPERRVWLEENVYGWKKDANGRFSKEVSPRVTKVACSCAGAVFAVGVDGVLYGSPNGGADAGSPWAQYGTGVSDVAAANEVYLLDRKGKLFRFNALPVVGAAWGRDARWEPMHHRLREVAVSPEGTLGGISMSGDAVVFSPTRTSTTVPTWVRAAGSVSDIIVQDAQNVYGLQQGLLVKRSPITGGFERLPIADTPLFSEVSVGCDGTLWGVAEPSASAARPSASSRRGDDVLVSASASQALAQAQARVFDFSSNRNLLSPNPPGDELSVSKAAEHESAEAARLYGAGRVVRLVGDAWLPVPNAGDIVHVSVCDRENVWGLSSEGTPMKWAEGIKAWTELPGASGVKAVVQIACSCKHDDAWAVTDSGDLWHYERDSGRWVLEAQKLVRYVAAGAGVYIIGKDDSLVYRYEPTSLEGQWVDLNGSKVATLSAGYDGSVWATDVMNRIVIINPGVAEKDAGDDIDKEAQQSGL
jgi:hypothetical protein